MTLIERLNRAELKAITGVGTRRLQIQWLAAKGWPFEVDHFGFPVVLRSVALERLGGEPAAETWQPDESRIA